MNSGCEIDVVDDVNFWLSIVFIVGELDTINVCCVWR